MTQLTLQPDAAAGKDATITARLPLNGYGVWNTLNIGELNITASGADRAVIQFDLSALPAAAIISSAVLSLFCTNDYSSNARTLRVYRLKRAWVEGTRNGTLDAPATGVTWNRYDAVNNWQTAGGFGADDCEQVDIGSRAFTATETINEFKAIALTPTTKAGLDLGNGWLLKMDTEVNDAYLFASSDHATAAWHPQLVIVYTLPAGLLLQLQNHGVQSGGTL